MTDTNPPDPMEQDADELLASRYRQPSTFTCPQCRAKAKETP